MKVVNRSAGYGLPLAMLKASDAFGTSVSCAKQPVDQPAAQDVDQVHVYTDDEMSLMSDEELMQLVQDELLGFEELDAMEWAPKDAKTQAECNQKQQEHNHNDPHKLDEASGLSAPTRKRPPRLNSSSSCSSSSPLLLSPSLTSSGASMRARSDRSCLLQEVEELKLRVRNIQLARQRKQAMVAIQPNASANSQSLAVVITTKATSQRKIWRRIAHDESIQRQYAERTNELLKGFLCTQAQMTQQLNQIIRDNMTMLAQQETSVESPLCVAVTPVKRRRVTSCDSPQPDAEAPVVPTQRQTRSLFVFIDQSSSEVRLQVLLQRIEFSFQQTDLVFQQPAQSMPFYRTPSAHSMYASPPAWATSAGCCWTLDQLPADPLYEIARYHSQKEEVVLHQDFAELSGFRVTPFDAPTLLNLLWRCFSVRARTFGLVVRNEHLFDTRGMDDVVHKQVLISATLCQNPVQVKSHSALKRFANVLVWEAIGQVQPEEEEDGTDEETAHTDTTEKNSWKAAANVEYTRCSWCRVDPLEDGRSVIRHVSRTMPVGDLAAELSGEVDLLHKQQQIELLGELMKCGQTKTAEFFNQLTRTHERRQSDACPFLSNAPTTTTTTR